VSCTEGIALGRLIDYAVVYGWDDEELEEHFFDCPACTARLQWLAAVADALPAVVQRSGGQRLVLTRELIDRLVARGVRLRHYHFDDNRRIACTVGAEDDLVVSWIPVVTGDDELLACDMIGPGGRVLATSDDMPFDRVRGELVLAEPADSLRRLPDMTMRLQLRAVGPAGTRSLGEYVYQHSAPR
jgi:hypothetical protein